MICYAQTLGNERIHRLTLCVCGGGVRALEHFDAQVFREIILICK